MGDRPILFSTPMIRALLAGRKTQTRRLLNPQPAVENGGLLSHPKLVGHFAPHVFGYCIAKIAGSPYGDAGSRLWVKETFRLRADQDHKPPSEDWWKSGAWYHADDESLQPSGCGGGAGKLRPAIFMPRWASRISLEITDVRCERLQEIAEEDANAEGVTPFFARFPEMGRDQRITSGELASAAEHRASFACVWDEINGDRALWISNPWVWALTFTVVVKS